jgi:hypothetical protein
MTCPCGFYQCQGGSCEDWSEYWKAMDLWLAAKPERPELCEGPSQSPKFIGITHGDPVKIALIAEIEAEVKARLPEGTILVDRSYIDPEASFYTECHALTAIVPGTWEDIKKLEEKFDNEWWYQNAKRFELISPCIMIEPSNMLESVNT